MYYRGGMAAGYVLRNSEMRNFMNLEEGLYFYPKFKGPYNLKD